MDETDFDTEHSVLVKNTSFSLITGFDLVDYNIVSILLCLGIELAFLIVL